IGYLLTGDSPGSVGRWIAALKQGLEALGYAEDRGFVVLERYAKPAPEDLRRAADELASAKVDVMGVPSYPPAGQGGVRSRPTFPVLMIAVPDPVASGLVASLARPGGRVTGISDQHSDLAAKRIELVKELKPSLARLGVFLNPERDDHRRQLAEAQRAGGALRL